MHHLATLVGYGASAVNPWLALQTVADEVESSGRHGEGITVEQAVENYCRALEKGLLKVMSKTASRRWTATAARRSSMRWGWTTSWCSAFISPARRLV